MNDPRNETENQMKLSEMHHALNELESEYKKCLDAGRIEELEYLIEEQENEIRLFTNQEQSFDEYFDR